MKDLSSSPRAQKAMQLFRQGYNCSQSVVLAWCEDAGLDFSTAAAFSAGFGGGMGRMREVCGTCTGAFMILGAKFGGYPPEDTDGKRKMYEIIQKFAERFKEENGAGTIICRELLGLDGKKFSPVPTPRTEEYYKKRPCPELAGLAAALLEEFIKTE